MIMLVRLLACVLMGCLASCGTFTKVSASGETTIQAGVLSSIQAVTVQVKPNKSGSPTVTVVQTGYDGTSVANNGIATIAPVAIAKYGFKTADSNNVKTSTINGQNVQGATDQLKITTDGTTQLAKIAKAPVPVP